MLWGNMPGYFLLPKTSIAGVSPAARRLKPKKHGHLNRGTHFSTFTNTYWQLVALIS
jgi:hypothetical protein